MREMKFETKQLFRLATYGLHCAYTIK